MAPPTGPLNSVKPTTSQTIGAVYNVSHPAPADQQQCALQLDNEGNLLINMAVGSVVATNPSVGPDNTTAPTSATEIGSVDAGGKLQAVSASNPLPVILNAETTKVIGVTRSADGAGNLLTSDARGSARPLAVEILDASGNQITSFGSGTVDIKGNSGATLDAAPGAAIPTNGLLVGGSDGTDLRALAVNSLGTLSING